MDQATRLAVVTGAAQGLGLAIANRLANTGATLLLCDVDGDGAERAARSLSSAADATAFPVDVADQASVHRLYAHIEERFGRLDILVNNAGISGVRAPLAELSLEDWERTIRVNLTGAFLMTRGAIPLMKRNSWGRIVQIASQAARARVSVGKSHYAASKAGIIGFTRILAGEVGLDGITVNCVAPSRTMTALTRANAAKEPGYFESGIAMTVVGRLAEPEDTAGAVAYLCSEEASFLSGAIIDVTGGAFMP